MGLPLKLNEVLFSNIPISKSQICFGPIVSHALAVWRAAEKVCGISFIWNPYSPIFYNDRLLIGKSPVKFGQCRQWYDKGIHSLGDILGTGVYTPLKNSHSGLIYNIPPFISTCSLEQP